MDLENFKASVANREEPPEGVEQALQALWWEKKGDWARAHNLSQGDSGRNGDWVHAYLHRVEGDTGNASYWYSRSEKPFSDGDVKAEWDAIATELLAL